MDKNQENGPNPSGLGTRGKGTVESIQACTSSELFLLNPTFNSIFYLCLSILISIGDQEKMQ